MDWYANVVAIAGEQDISYIGHSNGTFIVAEALKRYATVKFKYIALLASIVPCNYPWNDLIASGRVHALRTDLSADDSVVALFGGFFEVVRQNLGLDLGSFGEIGSSGIDGFHDSSAHTHEPKYFPGGHGGPVKPENFASLARFVVSGLSEVDPRLIVLNRSKRVSWLARLSVPAAFAILGLMPLAGY